MSAHALDVTAQDFESVVIEGSKRVPVVVDFWAPWCGPCRALKPVLEKLAGEYGGKFVLAKVNSDENHELATRYGVRGIPSVKAFVNGALVDEFSGALPEGAVREFIDRLLPSPAEILRARAAQSAAAGRPDEALMLLREALSAEPGNARVRVDMAEVLLDRGQAAEAEKILQALGPFERDEPRAAQLLAKLRFAGATGSSVADLRRRVTDDPADLAARLRLAHVLVTEGQYREAMDELLEVIHRERGFDDDAARKTLLAVFNLLGNQGELVAEYRRKLARALH